MMMFLLDGFPKELWNEVWAVGILGEVAGGATEGIEGFTLLHRPAGPSTPRQPNGSGDVECVVKTWWWGLVEEQSTQEHMDVQPSVCLAMIEGDVGGEAWVTVL